MHLLHITNPFEDLEFEYLPLKMDVRKYTFLLSGKKSLNCGEGSQIILIKGKMTTCLACLSQDNKPRLYIIGNAEPRFVRAIL